MPSFFDRLMGRLRPQSAPSASMSGNVVFGQVAPGDLIGGRSPCLSPATGYGASIAQESAVKDFTALSVSGAFEVHWSQGAPSLRIKAPASLLDLIETQISGDAQLVIGMSGSVGNHPPLIIECSSPMLSSVKLSGACHLQTMDDSSLTQPSLRMSGSSSCQALFVGRLQAQLSGSSSAAMQGQGAYGAHFKTSGSSRLDVSGGEAIGACIESSGASSVKASLAGVCSVVASGASSVNYSGAPSFSNRHVSGAATVKATKGPAPR
jgi:hypothetical protein